ncbi:MAG TPA: hypothetical protein VK149_00330 [Sideroxyarcus sp.]|nr:hypothetical protein [Sideroxyarcus sp.]
MKLVWRGFVFFLVCSASSIAAAAVSATQAERVISLADMGVSESITLHSRNFERHFYFPLPQGAALKNGRLEIRGRFFHPFDDRSALTILVNGEPRLTRTLSRRSEMLSLKLAEFGGSVYSSGNDTGQEFDLKLPISAAESKGGFLDIGIVLSAQLDAEHCVDLRGHGDELVIDPKMTRLSYSYDTDEVKDIRTLLAALPRQPVILLSGEKIGQAQYETALRLSQGLAGLGMRARFIAVPQVGDVVGTEGLSEIAEWGLIPSAGAIREAAKTRSRVKLRRAEDVAAWLIAHMLARDGLGQIVVDSVKTRQALAAALRHVPMSAALQQRIGRSEQWLGAGGNGDDNLRLARLGGKPVLLVEDIKATALIASLWQVLADVPKMGLESATALDKEYDGDLHFARNLPIQNIPSSGEWQIPLRLTDFPDGKWPDTFEINLRAAPGGDGQAPVASVILNDNLLMVEALHTDGEMTRVSAQAPLYAIRANNLLKVKVNRREEGGHCSHVGQEALVQLLPSSFATFRGAPDTTQFYMLQPMVSRHGQVVVPKRYLDSAAQTLSVVSSVLRGFSIGPESFALTVAEEDEFSPERPFIAFETAPASVSELISTANGRLVVYNGSEKKAFDSAGMGELAVVQLVRSHRKPGVYITSVTGTLPLSAVPLDFSEGSMAVFGKQGVKLAVNLDDPDNDYQLDEQNRGAVLVFQHYRVWFVLLGLLLLPVALVLGLRYYFRRQSRPQE